MTRQFGMLRIALGLLPGQGTTLFQRGFSKTRVDLASRRTATLEDARRERMGRGSETSARWPAEEPASIGLVGEAVFGADEADLTEFEAARRAAAQSRKHLRVEIALLRQRIADLRRDTDAAAQACRNAVRAELKWIDDSAHAQLGPHPWLKLLGTMAVTSIAVRMLRHAAVALIASQRSR